MWILQPRRSTGAAELWSSEKGTFGWFVCDDKMASMASIQKIHLGDGFEGDDIYQFINKLDSLGLDQPFHGV